MGNERLQPYRPTLERAPASAPAVEAAVARAVAGGPDAPVGRFRYDVAARSWWLSESLYRLYGLAPGQMPSPPDLLRSHDGDIDNRSPVEGVVPLPVEDGVFARRCSVRDARGRVRTLVLVGQTQRDEHHQVVAVLGYVADVSAQVRCAVAREATEAVERSALTRAVIEQAKGMVMAVRHTSAEEAFELLRWHSQQANVKLRDLAAIIVEGVPGTADGPHDEALDRLLEDVLRRGSPAHGSRGGPTGRAGDP